MREFCRETDIDPSFFSKVLSGKRSPPSEEAVLRRIAKVLELDAPSVIVASGRIPSEWRSLWEDPSVFLAVHRLAAGKPSARNSFSSRSASPADIAADASSSLVRKPYDTGASRKTPKNFGEELL